MSEPDLSPEGSPMQTERDTPNGGEEARLHALLEPTVEAHQLVLEGVSVKAAGKHRTVHVVVDLPDTETGGVSLDAIAEISHALSDVMDADPRGGSGAYDLEVSSPGVSRPLTEPRHWRRARGRLVKVNVIAGENVTGRLREVTDSGIVVVPDLPARAKGVKPKPGEPVGLTFDAIRSGKVEIEFSHLDLDDPADTLAADDADDADGTDLTDDETENAEEA